MHEENRTEDHPLPATWQNRLKAEKRHDSSRSVTHGAGSAKVAGHGTGITSGLDKVGPAKAEYHEPYCISFLLRSSYVTLPTPTNRWHHDMVLRAFTDIAEHYQLA